jgi:hypothetical protein
MGLATPSHVMGERGGEAGLWRTMNHSLRQDPIGSGGGKLSRLGFIGVWCTVCACACVCVCTYTHTHTHNTHTHTLILNLAAGKLSKRQKFSFKQNHSMMGAFNGLASIGNSTP